jgi:hypothetical protein
LRDRCLRLGRSVSLQLFKRGSHFCSLSINISETLLEIGYFFAVLSAGMRHHALCASRCTNHNSGSALKAARITKKVNHEMPAERYWRTF